MDEYSRRLGDDWFTLYLNFFFGLQLLIFSDVFGCFPYLNLPLNLILLSLSLLSLVYVLVRMTVNHELWRQTRFVFLMPKHFMQEQTRLYFYFILITLRVSFVLLLSSYDNLIVRIIAQYLFHHCLLYFMCPIIFIFQESFVLSRPFFYYFILIINLEKDISTASAYLMWWWLLLLLLGDDFHLFQCSLAHLWMHFSLSCTNFNDFFSHHTTF